MIWDDVVETETQRLLNVAVQFQRYDDPYATNRVEIECWAEQLAEDVADAGD